MAYTQHGSLDYVFGFDDPAAEQIASAIGVKPQTLSVSSEPEFTAEAKNLEGSTESVVVGEDKFTFTLNGFVTDKNLLFTGATFDYDGRHYIVMNRKLDVSNEDFQKAELSGSSYPLITQ